jgi:hypothetical protein
MPQVPRVSKSTAYCGLSELVGLNVPGKVFTNTDEEKDLHCLPALL